MKIQLALITLVVIASTVASTTPQKFEWKKGSPKITDEEMNEFREKKECAGYKPNKRIQCDISLYNANLQSKDQTINDILDAIKEWKKSEGTTESIYMLALDLNNWALRLGQAELIMGTTYASLYLSPAQYFAREYTVHYKKDRKPTIVYSIDDMEGNDVIDHWSKWTAVNGNDKGNVLYVSQGSTTKSEHKDECKSFYDLPKSLSDRDYVTVVLKGKICTKIPTTYRVVVGKYEKKTVRSLSETTYWMPKWECSYPDMTCEGSMQNEDLDKINSFLE